MKPARPDYKLTPKRDSGKLAFSASQSVWTFGQPWLPQPQSGLAPGRVSIGVCKGDLIVHAGLRDAHVMEDVFPFNYPAFTKCDAFEVFLGPVGESAYFEFHVTPSNSVLQLRFDDNKPRGNLEAHMLSESLFFSQTSITAEGWCVFARFPLKQLFSMLHSEWGLSFGRYDYTPGQPEPVISSTSPHMVCDFHRRAEWRTVCLETLPLIEPAFTVAACESSTSAVCQSAHPTMPARSRKPSDEWQAR